MFSAGDTHDEIIYERIKSLSPIIREVLSAFEEAVLSSANRQAILVDCHNYLEWILSQYDSGGTMWSGDVARFYGDFMLVAFVSTLASHQMFEEIDAFLGAPFFLPNYGEFTGKATSFSRLGGHIKSMDHRNQRLNLRRISLHSDLIKEVCEASGLAFREFMQADLLVFVRALNKMDHWWPASLLYVVDASGSLPLYIRAANNYSAPAFLKALGLSGKTELDTLIAKFKSGLAKGPQWSGGFGRVDVLEQANLEALASCI